MDTLLATGARPALRAAAGPREITFEEVRRLARLDSLHLLDTPPEAVLDVFTGMAARLTGRPVALLSLVDARRQWVKAATGTQPGGSVPRSRSLCAHAIESGDSLFEVEDARTDPRFAGGARFADLSPVAHYAGAPLVMPGGERIGTLCVMDERPGRLDAHQRALLVQLARGAVDVLLLRENERELRQESALGGAELLAEFAPVGMFWTDARGRVVHGNRQWVEMLGLASVADGCDTGWMAAVHPDDVAMLGRRWSQAVANVVPCVGTLRLRERPGEPTRWVKYRAEPVHAPTGAAFVGVTVDITETMRLQDELLAKNQLLESVIENLPCGLSVFDPALKHVVSNRRARAMLDVPDAVLDAPEATLETVQRFLAARGDYGSGDVEALAAARIAASRGAHLRERTRADGMVVQIRGNEMPGGGIVTTYTDVTAERRAAAELAASQRRLSRALEATSLGLWEYDPATRQYHFSEGWPRLLALPALDPSLAGPQVESFMAPEEIARLRDQQRLLLKGELDQLDIEHLVVGGDGQPVWLHTMAQVSDRDAQGRALRVVGTCKDISARRQSEAALHSALEAAGLASRAKGDFLATMSHEIRTPINGVIGLAQLLANTTLPATESGYVKMIGSCAKSLLSLVDNILDFSKIEAGRMEVEEADTGLRELLVEVADLFAVRAAEKDIDFECHVAPDVPARILGDAARLRQVLLNLLGNALKFTAKGGFALDVRLRNAPEGTRLCFAVRDSGIGISQVDQARLFTRFTQSDGSASRKYPGTGLGLAISRQLAQLMGGDIELASWAGLGSTFTLVLPLRAAAADPGRPVAGEVLQPGGSTASLLLVEDNMVNQVVLRGLLANLGYARVTLAMDGLQALAACERESFDLVLMDCQMPEMDGLRATRILRERGVRTPIVAVTASAVTGDRERCFEAGMDDYLTKPVELPALAAKLRRWLGGAAPPAPVPVEAPGREPSAAAFDRRAVQERFFNDARLYGECRRIFLRQTPAWLEDLRGCMETGDHGRARSLAHSVKGSAATIGAQRLADCCRSVELALEPGGAGAEAALACVPQARQAFEEFMLASASEASPAARGTAP